MSDTKKENSLIECMKEVPDPRAPYNQKHKFIDIIIIAVTAILCGMDTWNEIEDWAYSKREWLETFLELPGGIPSHDTINRVFQMMDPVKFHDAFFRWLYLLNRIVLLLCPNKIELSYKVKKIVLICTRFYSPIWIRLLQMQKSWIKLIKVNSHYFLD